MNIFKIMPIQTIGTVAVLWSNLSKNGIDNIYKSSIIVFEQQTR